MNIHSLEELQARAIVHTDRFNLWQRHAGEKAITRLLQDASISPTPSSLSSADDAITRHAELVAGQSKAGDEQCVLRQLLALPAIPAPVAARIVAGTATLDDALAVLDLRTDIAQRGRLRGVVEHLAEVITGLKVGGASRVLANVRSIDAQLANLSHTAFAIAKGSWPGYCSRIRRVVRLVDCTDGRSLRKSQLVGPWADLVAVIDQHAGGDKELDERTQTQCTIGGYRAKLWPLVAFCTRRGTPPESVDDRTIEQLLEDCVTRQLDDPFATARDTVYAWENLQRLVSAFPRQRLSRLYRDGHSRHGRLAFDQLPESFQADWLAFVARHERKPVQDPASLVVDSAQAPRRRRKAHRTIGRIASARLPNLKSTILLAANALIALGGVPNRLADVLTLEVADRAMDDLFARQTAKDPDMPEKNSSLKNMASNLLAVAQLVSVDDTIIAGLVETRDEADPHLVEVRVDKNGKTQRIYDDERMGPRHRERLKQISDPIKLLSWFQMMEVLFGRMRQIVKERRVPTEEEVNDAIACVLHAVTQSCPIRNGNIAAITITGRNCWLMLPRLKGDKASLIIPAAFVKNRKQIDGELTEEATEVVRFFVEHFRPVLAKRAGAAPDNPYLFPAAGHRHRGGNQLNRIFLDRNWKVGGIELNLQCQRHIAGKLMLDEDVNNMGRVQQMLDHKSIETTKRYYAFVNKLVVVREFHALIARRREAVLALVNDQKRHSGSRKKR
jgi:integrase